jgi:3-hydroxyacyl-[acyl-carrier-protein] dehydratase
MTFEAIRIIRANHPSLPGHFPDAPLVPGVVILDEVIAALAEWQQNSQLNGIRMVKFLAPLKPEQAFTISLSLRNERAAAVNFCCRAEDRVIVEGQLEVAWGSKMTR